MKSALCAPSVPPASQRLTRRPDLVGKGYSRNPSIASTQSLVFS